MSPPLAGSYIPRPRAFPPAPGRMNSQPSGIPNLDRVLGGGVPTGDLVLVAGAAGSGKTTLALQMAFHVAARDGTACFASTTSESPERLLEHARSYEFYDESQIGSRFFLLSLVPLIHDGLQPVRSALEREVREHGATLLVLDGLTTLYDLHPQAREVRRFLYELSGMLSTLGCTLLVTSSRREVEAPAAAAELTMADVLIRLSQPVSSARSQRLLQAVKVRGRTPLLGLHGMRLDHRGVAVHPRFESLARPMDARIGDERVSSGLPELDAMLSGGLPTGSVTAVAGAVGTGKTLLGLQFLLEGARRGETGLLLTLHETERELIARARRFGMDLEAPIRAGRVVVVHHVPVDLSIDAVMQELDAALEHARPARFVLDGFGELLEPIAEEPRRRALPPLLANLLRSRGITAMIPAPVSKAAGPELDLERAPVAALAHNLVLLRHVEYQGELHRVLSLLKVRDSEFDASIRRYVITSSGLRMFAPTDTAPGLLAGIGGLPSEARIKRTPEPDGDR
jgi:circadian clock protein KaiC